MCRRSPSNLHLAVLAVTTAGCIHWGAPEPRVAPPASPGDACAERGPKACPEGMWCTNAQYSHRRLEKPGRCELESGRCASACDCRPTDTCVRRLPAAGYCAPAPALAAPANACGP